MAKKKIKERKVSEEKKAVFAKLVELAKKSNTIMIISIENIQSANLQQIKKELKSKATIKITKKNLVLKALNELKKEKPEIATLEKWVEKPSFAIIFSNVDPFELAEILSNYKFPAKIKPGQISPEEITLEQGVTDIPAGPLLSELSSLGIKTGIEGGKIAIKERKVLVKKNEKISAEIASILTKLEITPFNVCPLPLAAYDNKENKVYEEIKIDKEATIKELKESISCANMLSISIAYPVPENIQILLKKANQELNILSNLIK